MTYRVVFKSHLAIIKHLTFCYPLGCSSAPPPLSCGSPSFYQVIW